MTVSSMSTSPVKALIGPKFESPSSDGMAGKQRCNQSRTNTDIRQKYAISLDTMKNAHLKAFFYMKTQVKATQEGIPLTPAFSCFHPCPLKLSLVELCNEPLDINSIPEFLYGHEDEFAALHGRYQAMSTQAKKQIFENLIDDQSAEEEVKSNHLLDEFISQIDSPRLAGVISTFQKDVYDAKELIDFLKKMVKSDQSLKNPVSNGMYTIDTILMRILSSMVKTGRVPNCQPAMLSSFFEKVSTLKEKYDSLDVAAKQLLDSQCQYGNHLGLRHERKAQEILCELESIIEKVKANNSSFMPSLVDLVYQQAQIVS